MNDMLTTSQQRVFDAIDRMVSTGKNPSIRDICRATGLSSPGTVHKIMKILRRKGYVLVDYGAEKTVKVMKKSYTHPALAALARCAV